jgi:hypothetical protein
LQGASLKRRQTRRKEAIMYTVKKTKMKVLVKDPDSAAILEKYCPGCLKHPQLKMAFNFPLEVI